jgi:hypothetical protein
MSVTSAVAVVASMTIAVIVGATPNAAHAISVDHAESGWATPSRVSTSSIPTSGPIDCTADPALRFVRPCVIHTGQAR